MLRRCLSRLHLPERDFAHPGESPMSHTGGLPFYGNVFSGRVNPQTYNPVLQGGGLIDAPSNALDGVWSNPAIRARIEACPYFALCDQAVYHNMDPVYLDPGVLTPEEHHLLLLFSRAYFHKWKTIKSRPPPAAPRLRLEYGATVLLDEICALLDVPSSALLTLKKEYSVDDSSLIAMEPSLWVSAYLDPANLDILSGRVLDFADVPTPTQDKLFTLLRQMRRIHIIRRDVADATPSSEQERHLIVPFKCAVTLYGLYTYLGLPPYSGQLKVYDFVDKKGTSRVETLSDEDVYFDYLYALFYKANIRNATLSELADDKDHTCRYTITVEPFTSAERRVGSWF